MIPSPMGMRQYSTTSFSMADREAKIKRIGALLMQQDGENPIVNEALPLMPPRWPAPHPGSGDRVDFLADFSQDRQRLPRDLQLRIESS